MGKPCIAQVSGARMLGAPLHRARMWHVAAVSVDCHMVTINADSISNMSPEQAPLFPRLDCGQTLLGGWPFICMTALICVFLCD